MNENTWKEKWSKSQIKAMLLEQGQAFWQREPGTERTQLKAIERAAPLPHAIIVSGLRRVGKSTLLAQMAHRLGQNQFYYVNFEDDRFLGFQAENANELYAALLELFGERKIFILDEVQNIPGWEHFVRRFMEMGFKFYITGSNASLISRELGTRLTGRYIPIELFPFSFSEYLRFRVGDIPDLRRTTTTDTARLQHSLDEYLRLGGIPEPLKYPNLQLLRTLYDDVLYRDIATRHRIEEVRALKELAFYLMSNPGNLVSFNKLKDQFQLGSINTIKNYIEYMENSWLFFTLNVYDYSVKRQQIAAKKIYAIDTGLANEVGFTFSANTGRLLENLIFLALRRKTNEIHYYKTPTGLEVDFYLPEQRQLIQVTQNLNQSSTRERDLRALVDGMRSVPKSTGLILTDANLPDATVDGFTVEFRSIAEWLVENS